ncbi:LuxR C-terminal-related transcriptional regulator [Novosphingobium terrae]|uniref:LuxR C-terminal-related transcriptional regulator n=1 Tax=Novosphingobium terrae TaxID=2726189 RepID=UPI00197D024B|nr:response regulator transcription factor [Novosphingobium terrae]
MRTDVCIVSEYEISREGLKNILKTEGFRVVDLFATVAEAVNSSLPQDAFIVLDGFPVAEQAGLVKDIMDHCQTSLVAVLSERFDVNAMIACFQNGAKGYIVRSMKALPMTTSLRLAAMGERVIPSDLVDLFNRQPLGELQNAEPKGNTFPGSEAAHNGHDLSGSAMDQTALSPRERDVLRCLMAGYSNKLIARRLVVCEATVKVHVKAILRKLNVNNRTQAAIWASSRGISEARLAP